EAKKPAPEALALLADSPSFAGIASRRLAQARFSVEDGQLLSECLYRSGLLSHGALALARAGERMKNLPWVFAELGEILGARAVRFIRQFSLVVMPINVVGLAVVVGFIVVAMFVPMIQILSELSR